MYLNSHNLETETDRHNNVLLNFCKRDLEDEFHFVCPHFEDIFVKKIIKKYYWQRPNVFKCEQLLSIHNIRDLCNLGKYINFAFKSREGIFSESYTPSNISNINVICFFFFCIITENITSATKFDYVCLKQ